MLFSSRQQGAALLIVLMVVALVAILATEMGARLQLQVQRAINIKDNNQAYWYAVSAEEFARKSLHTLMRETRDKIHLNQPWAEQFEYPMDSGSISASLEDMQSCFNLNALPGAAQQNASATQPPEVLAAFGRLLTLINADIDSYTADTIRDSVGDWIDADDQMRSYGAEDSEYASRPVPYLAANSMMASQSELRLIKGVEPQWLDALLPLVCVIPNNDLMAINVNTLTDNHAPLLAALTGLSTDQASGVINARPQDGWSNINDFLAEPDLTALQLVAPQTDWFTVTTEYFILHTKSRYNEASVAMSTVFNATADDIHILRREFGVLK